MCLAGQRNKQDDIWKRNHVRHWVSRKVFSQEGWSEIQGCVFWESRVWFCWGVFALMVEQEEEKASFHFKSIPTCYSWALASLTPFPPLAGYGEGSSHAVIDPIHRQSSLSESSSPITQRKQGLVNLMDDSLGGVWEPKATHTDPGSNTRV